ncbi:unnamed protein product [Peniophora sp. CBMAI 1063]|nr:unnamed protein product [Peniophora sp. CBMAI 1063]
MNTDPIRAPNVDDDLPIIALSPSSSPPPSPLQLSPAPPASPAPTAVRPSASYGPVVVDVVPRTLCSLKDIALEIPGAVSLNAPIAITPSPVNKLTHAITHLESSVPEASLGLTSNHITPSLDVPGKADEDHMIDPSIDVDCKVPSGVDDSHPVMQFLLWQCEDARTSHDNAERAFNLTLLRRLKSVHNSFEFDMVNRGLDIYRKEMSLNAERLTLAQSCLARYTNTSVAVSQAATPDASCRCHTSHLICTFEGCKMSGFIERLAKFFPGGSTELVKQFVHSTEHRMLETYPRSTQDSTPEEVRSRNVHVTPMLQAAVRPSHTRVLDNTLDGSRTGSEATLLEDAVPVEALGSVPVYHEWFVVYKSRMDPTRGNTRIYKASDVVDSNYLRRLEPVSNITSFFTLEEASAFKHWIDRSDWNVSKGVDY